ncbi:prepilin peptidase [Candidatus Woesearchaeota archaeon]|nr:prepilin peptidase [Candidatus Woesearchaeota archaeon]
MTINFILLLLLGLYTSWTDIRSHKIKNWAAWSGIFAGILLTLQEQNPLQKIIVCIAIGFILWSLKFWTAGDGKLYTAFSLLIPGGQSWLLLMIVTFVPLFIHLSISAILKTRMLHIIKTIINILRPRHLAITAIAIFAFTTAASILELFIGTLPMLYKLSIFIALFMVIHRLKLFYIIAIPLIIYGLATEPLQRLQETGFLLLYFICFRFFALELGYFAMTKEIPLHKVKPGMVLAEDILNTTNGIVRRKRLFFSIFGYLKADEEKIIISAEPEGLSRNQIQQLKQHNANAVRIHEIVPFAPALTVGATVTYFLPQLLLFIIEVRSLI